MKISEARYKMLYLGQGKPWCQYRLGIEWVDLGVLVDERLVLSQQCEPAAQKESKAAWAAGGGRWFCSSTSSS